MMPLTKFETIFCRPKPSPTPTAPLNTAKAVRSMPTVLRPITIASVTSTIFTRLPASACTDEPGIEPEPRHRPLRDHEQQPSKDRYHEATQLAGPSAARKIALDPFGERVGDAAGRETDAPGEREGAGDQREPQHQPFEHLARQSELTRLV